MNERLTTKHSGEEIRLSGISEKHSDDEENDFTSQRVQEELTTTDVEEVREKWSTKVDFMLSIIGYCVGLGNVWRFPYLCYQNGGATFLIPYFTMLVLCGIPMMLCEFSLGQYLSLAPLSTFTAMCRVSRGLGMSMMMASFLSATYYNVIICWSVVYLFSSFASEVPWKECDPAWASDKCRTVDQRRHENDLLLNCTNGTVWINATYSEDCTGLADVVPSSLEYFYNYVLGKTESIGDMGNFEWKVCLALIFCWVVVYLCLFRGVKTSGKVVWVTATMPYVVLIVLFIRGVTLEGAGVGIEFYLTPQWGKLLNIKVWVAAASQIFYSLGISWGTVLVYGSYNKFNNNCVFDSILVSCVNCGTSFFAGFVVFSVLGFMSVQLNTDIAKVATSGPGLAFNVYPEAISRLPISPLWAILFFLMLFTLGLDSQFGSLESILAGVVDEYGGVFRKHKGWFTASVCFTLFVLSLPMCTGSGMFILNLLDTQAGGVALLYVAFIEAVVIGWGYGAGRLADNIETMIGRKPPLYFIICWKFVSPILLGVILFSNIIQWEGVSLDDYHYPQWSEAIGWIFALSSMLFVPGIAIYEIYKSPGATLLQKLKNSLRADDALIIENEKRQVSDMNGGNVSA